MRMSVQSLRTINNQKSLVIVIKEGDAAII